MTELEPAVTTPQHGEGTQWRIATNPGLSAAVDAYFSRYNQPFSAGAIIAVLKGGQTIHLNGYGCANFEFNVPWTPDIPYTFFSVSKTMLAAAMLRLADSGAFSTEDRVDAHLPDFPRYQHPITIRHLLTHTSGLWQDEALVNFAGGGLNERPVSLDEIYALTIRQKQPACRPGSHHYYNDAGCRVAARVLERVTGRSFGDAMRSCLFEPAGMHGAYTSLSEPSRRRLQASAYFYGEPGAGPGTGFRVGTVVHESSGDGGVCGSITDLIAFARYLAAGTVSGRMIDRLAAPVEYRPGRVGHYRTCLNVFQHRGLETRSHSGLFGKRMVYVPGLDMWILVMRNALETPQGTHFTDGLGQLLDLVLPHDTDGRAHLKVHPQAAVCYPMAPPQHFTDEEFDLLSGTFVEPESGYVLHVSPEAERLQASFLGETAEIVRDAAGQGYTTHPGGISFDLVMEADDASAAAALATGDLCLMQADWKTPRPLTRVISGEAPSAPGAAYQGLYISSDYDTTMRVQAVGGGLDLVIGSGLRVSDRLRLQHVWHDIFEAAAPPTMAAQMATILIRFERSGAKANGFTLSTDGVRGLPFRAVHFDEIS